MRIAKFKGAFTLTLSETFVFFRAEGAALVAKALTDMAAASIKAPKSEKNFLASNIMFPSFIVAKP
jgi:hypothetical protein